MRISDWSSDVCSSDLLHLVLKLGGGVEWREIDDRGAYGERTIIGRDIMGYVGQKQAHPIAFANAHRLQTMRHAPYTFRSEEHTSELQSLMRISYAAFCLKKKKSTK